jgi:hypothetical protein
LLSTADGYACSDLRWESKRYLKAREELVAGAMIQYDLDASVVMIERWFKHNPPTSEDHLTGIERLLDHLPSSITRCTNLKSLIKRNKECESNRFG